MKQFIIATMILIATLLIVGSVAWVKDVQVAMPVKKHGHMIHYNKKVQEVYKNTQ